jgi:hypothetical protein
MPAPPQPPFFQPPELLPHFEKLPPAEKGGDGKFTRTKRSGGEPFERICVLMPPELVEAVLGNRRGRRIASLNNLAQGGHTRVGSCPRRGGKRDRP